MQGNWRVTTSQVGDEQADPAEMARRRVIVKGDKLTYEYGNPQHEKREGTIKLDPATHAFDLFVPFENVTALAIYELKGDTLRIGFGNDGLIRPRIWHLGPQDVAWLLVLKREKPDARIELQMLEGTWQPTWVESGGVKAAAKDIEGFNQPTVIKDGKTTWRYENKDYDVAITVDPTESPKTIDRQAIGGDGLLKDLVSRAIYELAGDTLRICFNAEREEQRPKNFRSDETFVIVTFARKTD